MLDIKKEWQERHSKGNEFEEGATTIDRNKQVEGIENDKII